VIFNIVQFVIGLAALLTGAYLLIEGAASIARKLGVSTLLIGFTIVAFGTSAPELAINITANLTGHGDIAIGNILGSNISNIFLVVGAAAIIAPLTLARKTVGRAVSFALLAMVTLATFLNTGNSGAGMQFLTRLDGILLLVLFMFFYRDILTLRAQRLPQKPATTARPITAALFAVFGGIIGLTIGGHWIVVSSTTAATMLSINESVDALTVVAFGTALPELATSVVAAIKRKNDFVVGSILGSIVFNTLFILGASAVIQPIPFSQGLGLNAIIALGALVILAVTVSFNRQNKIARWQGVAFLALYAAYIGYLIV
jgi:cation:H+ antiporter